MKIKRAQETASERYVDFHISFSALILYSGEISYVKQTFAQTSQIGYHTQ